MAGAAQEVPGLALQPEEGLKAIEGRERRQTICCL
jgi:hypothetical protein